MIDATPSSSSPGAAAQRVPSRWKGLPRNHRMLVMSIIFLSIHLLWSNQQNLAVYPARIGGTSIASAATATTSTTTTASLEEVTSLTSTATTFNDTVGVGVGVGIGIMEERNLVSSPTVTTTAAKETAPSSTTISAVAVEANMTPIKALTGMTENGAVADTARSDTEEQRPASVRSDQMEYVNTTTSTAEAPRSPASIQSSVVATSTGIIARADSPPPPPKNSKSSIRAPLPSPSPNKTTVGLIFDPKTIPHFIIMGTQKGGSSLLASKLSVHPQCWGSKHEAHFFDKRMEKVDDDGRVKVDIPFLLWTYHKRFPTMNQLNETFHSKQKKGLVFEKTPEYVLYPKVAYLINATVPWAKLIFVLRDPAERAFSHYQMVKKWGCCFPPHEMPTLDDCVQYDIAHLQQVGILNNPEQFWNLEQRVRERLWVNYTNNIETTVVDGYPKNMATFCSALVGRGLYAIQLEIYHRLYQEGGDNRLDQLFVYKSENMRPNKLGEVDFSPFTDFLGIEPIPLKRGSNVVHSRGPNAPKLANGTRVMLNELYRPFTERLGVLLGEPWGGDF